VENTVYSLAKDIAERRVSPLKIVSETIEKIEKENQKLNCFITILKEYALQQAERAEKEILEGRYRGPLHGIPIAIKDIIYVKGVRCTAGSKILLENVAEYDAIVTKKLKEAGAVIVGTTNLHEFASGVTSVNPHFGPVRNPWDKARIAGGSSGGSAAAVSASLVPIALGTDTSGSIRIPAALCGTVGLKPTYGTVSRIGVIPLASSFDTVGPIGRSVFDCWITLKEITGHESYDITTVEFSVKGLEERAREKTYSVGIPVNMLKDVEEGVLKVFEGFKKRLDNLGFKLKEFELPEVEKLNSVWETIRRAEASAFHAGWLRNFAEMYGKDVREKLELGMKIYAIDYINAQNIRPHLRNVYLASIEGLDFIAMPTTLVPAPKIGEESIVVGEKNLSVYDALSHNTRLFNALGFPAISIPCGLSGGLPVGAQLVGKPYEDTVLLEASSIYEERYGFQEVPKV
jgi:aspartyl-tRNA(Asn)/glutamyl-tRNA(Gln) amidotransferase subunit A